VVLAEVAEAVLVVVVPAGDGRKKDSRFKIQDSRSKILFGKEYLRRFRIIALIAVYPLIVAGQPGDTARLSLVFAGDLMGHQEQIAGAWDSATGSYNYEPTFRYIKPFLEQADIAVVNLEVTLAGPPYKGYPQFSSPDALALAARDAGFDVFIQANNHALDRGQKGFKRTLYVLDSLKIAHTGTFADSLDRNQNYPLLLERKGIRIALLNYTYGTNGITIPKPFIINRIDTTQIRQDLAKARLAGPDFIIVTIHWGEEYQRTENRAQQHLAAFILNHGADAIIGSHPHVIQPVRWYTGADSTQQKVVVYSQGNFVSNQRARYKDGGIIVELNLVKAAGKTNLEEFSYLPTWVYREDLPIKSIFYIVPVAFYENNTSALNLLDRDRYKISQFATETREHLKGTKENHYFK
jgi:poly-gamma-glutamate capsule biosynthesis protein CapA/YwtB (metallophosphatase superfamily)